MHLARLRQVRRIDPPSVLIAIALTTAGFAAVLVVSAPTLLFFRAVIRAAGRGTSQETLVFFEQPRAAAPVRHASPTLATTRSAVRERHASAAAADERVTRSAAGVAPRQRSRTAESTDPSPTFLPRYHAPIRFTPSPFELPHVRNPFLSEAPRTRAELDSILAVRRDSIPTLSMTYTPTVAVRDSLIKAQARNNVVPGRAPQMLGNGIGGGIGFTFLSPGPSAAERRRDSAANSEYVARLRRLQDRVRSARESLRLADSMARRSTP